MNNKFSLEDKYNLLEGRIVLSGIQALVRLLLDQNRADLIKGLNTGTLVSGYRGSPVGVLDINLVKNKKEIDNNISKNEFNVIDARSRERFEGKVIEPRKGLRSGCIQNSYCLPFSELINEDHTFINKDKILEKFKSLKFDTNKNAVFSCGSGITASVLALAYSLINAKYMPTIYDGSWSEYGKN